MWIPMIDNTFEAVNFIFLRTVFLYICTYHSSVCNAIFRCAYEVFFLSSNIQRKLFLSICTSWQFKIWYQCSNVVVGRTDFSERFGQPNSILWSFPKPYLLTISAEFCNVKIIHRTQCK